MARAGLQYVLAAACGLAGGSAALAQVGGTGGPDVIVGALIDIARWGAVGDTVAYSVGTTSCNPGTEPVLWIANDNRHPVIGQNMYRLKNGRFEQIGQSWLKHGFLSVNGNFCGSCVQPPMGGAQLGVNCSDPYGSGLNGSQGNLGPRSQVNASTGSYPYPWTAPSAPATIGRRLQVKIADIDPALNPGALYFVEGHYITADDALAGNGLNNASYRRVTIANVNSVPAFVPGQATQQTRPAIRAWKDTDPAVTLTPASYLDGGVLAQLLIAAKVTDNGNGTWHYEYAIQNLNSHRSGGSFSIPVPAGATVTNAGFSAPFSHSGEPYNNVAWTSTVDSGAVTWATAQTFAQNPNANALRWGTMYNFRFDANVAPGTGTATLGLFRPGTPETVAAAGVPMPAGTLPCAPDVNGDGTVNVADFLAFLGLYSDGAPAADFDGNGTVDVQDFLAFLGAYSAGC